MCVCMCMYSCFNNAGVDDVCVCVCVCECVCIELRACLKVQVFKTKANNADLNTYKT